MPEPIIDVRDLTKVYDSGAIRVEALRGVTLRVERGEIGVTVETPKAGSNKKGRN